jgi:hypothetical protein
MTWRPSENQTVGDELAFIRNVFGDDLVGLAGNERRRTISGFLFW